MTCSARPLDGLLFRSGVDVFSCKLFLFVVSVLLGILCEHPKTGIEINDVFSLNGCSRVEAEEEYNEDVSPGCFDFLGLSNTAVCWREP